LEGGHPGLGLQRELFFVLTHSVCGNLLGNKYNNKPTEPKNSNLKQDKHKENYTKAHHDQRLKTTDKKENL
jgi:hypothetical protein